mgnify:CR=1 FL=1
MSIMFKGELKDTKKGIKQESRGTLSSKSKPSLFFTLVSYYFDFFFLPHISHFGATHISTEKILIIRISIKQLSTYMVR